MNRLWEIVFSDGVKVYVEEDFICPDKAIAKAEAIRDGSYFKRNQKNQEKRRNYYDQ